MTEDTDNDFDEEYVNEAIRTKITIDEILERGIDATEYERILAMIALTGGDGNILFECSEQQALILSVMNAIVDPMNLDGTIDDVVAIDNPVIRSFVQGFKLNMKSNKRKGLMEIVKVMVGDQEDEGGAVSRIKEALKGDD